MNQSDIALKVAQIKTIDINTIESKGIQSLTKFIQNG